MPNSCLRHRPEIRITSVLRLILDLLFRNNRNGTFTEIGANAGLSGKERCGYRPTGHIPVAPYERSRGAACGRRRQVRWL
jgi:hypothetical protein